jgi:hypothetical protein
VTAAAGVRTDSLVDQIGDWFADRGDEIAASAGKIAFIVVLALVINYLLRRTIRRTVAKIAATGGHERLSLDQPRAATVDPARALAGERRMQRTQALGSVLSSGVSVIVFTTAIVMILGEMGVSLGPILASAGIAGVALGFGAQNMVKDFLAGIFVVVEDQYGVGDVIDAGLASGTVEEVGLRITRLRDLNGVIWYVRNGEVVRVGNKTQGWAMATIDVMVAYDEDLGTDPGRRIRGGRRRHHPCDDQDRTAGVTGRRSRAQGAAQGGLRRCGHPGTAPPVRRCAAGDVHAGNPDARRIAGRQPSRLRWLALAKSSGRGGACET